MAGLLCSAASAAGVAIPGGSVARTLVQLTAATNQRIKIKRFGATFAGTDPTKARIQVFIARQDILLPNSPANITPQKLDPAAQESIQTTAVGTQGGVETTVTNQRLLPMGSHPQSGYESVNSFGDEIIVPGGQRIGLVVVAPDAVSGEGYILFEE